MDWIYYYVCRENVWTEWCCSAPEAKDRGSHMQTLAMPAKSGQVLSKDMN